MSKRGIKRRVRAAVETQKAYVALVDRCDKMNDDMEQYGYDPADVRVFRDLVLDGLHGAEEELLDACTAATIAGIQVHVRTREPFSLMRAAHQQEESSNV